MFAKQTICIFLPIYRAANLHLPNVLKFYDFIEDTHLYLKITICTRTKQFKKLIFNCKLIAFIANFLFFINIFCKINKNFVSCPTPLLVLDYIKFVREYAAPTFIISINSCLILSALACPSVSFVVLCSTYRPQF